ncbi:MAG TPA: S1C family serine protease [Stellaceae bacterium]|nr:S1C family serine protease [Stellaceae bacterium]
MSESSDWEIPPQAQPKPADWPFDLDRALSAVLGLRATVPADAYTAGTLGTERAGNGVLIREDGVVLTIGYLITEADSVWLNTNDGRAVPGHVMAYDQETGFGLVQALARLKLPPLPLGRSASAQPGDRVIVAGAGGRPHALNARIAAKQEFAGYWEYLLDEAIFTVPAHPNWGGTAVIDGEGALIALGSLHLQQGGEGNERDHLNMTVPIDLLPPILDDLLTLGRPNHPPRPWLGLYATEIDDKVVVAGLASGAPARRAGLKTGDIVLAVAGEEIADLASLYRKVWRRGAAGVEVPMVVFRGGRTLDLEVRSADRTQFLKSPSLH